MAPTLVNLGCGHRYHRAWINIDLVGGDNGVIVHDLRRGIPLPSSSCDAVYHSCILEHFGHAEALGFMKECARVLKPGGVVRVAVPDLERICRLYLSKLDDAAAGRPGAEYDYDWMMLELYDQAVREKSGGRMAEYFVEQIRHNEAFVVERIGAEALELLQAARGAAPPAAAEPRARAWGRVFHGLRRPGLVARRAAGVARRLGGGGVDVLLRLLGVDEDAVRVVRFRSRGEIHKWMYDRYSLARLMRRAGLADPHEVAPGASSIAEWASYHLDRLPDGTVIKPDAIVMEAVRPGEVGR